MSMEEIFGPVIYAYTRAQALEDGELVDVSETAREAGWKYPVVVTRHVWVDVVEPDREAQAAGESAQGRLWDVVWVASRAAKAQGDDRVEFDLLATKDKKKVVHHLVAHCGPGDDAAPVITIMFPEDD